MYAFISNEYRAIVYSRRQLDFLCSVYSYPQFKMVNKVEEANAFFAEHGRLFYKPSLNQYGKVDNIGYITIKYFIDGKNIYVNVYTKHFGFIKLSSLPKNVKQESTYDLLRLEICNVILQNNLIAHHCTAIMNILSLFDSYINIELVLPDISVYLACTKYKGTNFSIRNLQRVISSRMGVTFYTI